MRDRTFRIAALVLGILGIPSLILQIHRAWPLDQVRLYFYGGQAMMLFIFLSYGLRIGPMALGHSEREPDE